MLKSVKVLRIKQRGRDLDGKNEWMMHLYSALLCIVVHPKRFKTMWGSLLNHHQCAASTWMRSPQKCWWISWRTCSQWVGKRKDNLCDHLCTVVFLRNSLMPEAILWHTHDQTHTHTHTHTPHTHTHTHTHTHEYRFHSQSQLGKPTSTSTNFHSGQEYFTLSSLNWIV